MTDVQIKCDRFDCMVIPQTQRGKKWMRENAVTVADTDMAKVSAETIGDFKKDLDKDGITYDHIGR